MENSEINIEELSLEEQINKKKKIEKKLRKLSTKQDEIVDRKKIIDNFEEFVATTKELEKNLLISIEENTTLKDKLTTSIEILSNKDKEEEIGKYGEYITLESVCLDIDELYDRTKEDTGYCSLTIELSNGDNFEDEEMEFAYSGYKEVIWFGQVMDCDYMSEYLNKLSPRLVSEIRKEISEQGEAEAKSTFVRGDFYIDG